MGSNRQYKIRENKIIEIVEGSITEYEADALVCPANADLEPLIMPGNLQYYFYRGGGEEIFREARKLGETFRQMSMDTAIPMAARETSAHLTGAGRLPAKYVIHSVAVGYDLKKSRLYCNRDIIAKSVRNVLDVGKKNKLNSIGFPALGTGLYQVPLEQCVEATISEFSEHLKQETPIERLGLILYGEQNFYVAKIVCDTLKWQS